MRRDTGQIGSDALDAVEVLIQALSDEVAKVRSKAAKEKS